MNMKGQATFLLFDPQVAHAADRLNNRPRKTPGYRTLAEVFFASHRVALKS